MPFAAPIVPTTSELAAGSLITLILAAAALFLVVYAATRLALRHHDRRR
ncbi:hypothetical protein [Bailinhaonella thermotolerans]|nr:hypothetical protein [Bailinhaonella thermotolerans]